MSVLLVRQGQLKRGESMDRQVKALASAYIYTYTVKYIHNFIHDTTNNKNLYCNNLKHDTVNWLQRAKLLPGTFSTIQPELLHYIIT